MTSPNNTLRETVAREVAAFASECLKAVGKNIDVFADADGPLECADRILAALPPGDEGLVEALRDLEREAHATRDTANGNTWMHGKAEGLMEAVGRIEFALLNHQNKEAR